MYILIWTLNENSILNTHMYIIDKEGGKYTEIPHQWVEYMCLLLRFRSIAHKYMYMFRYEYDVCTSFLLCIFSDTIYGGKYLIIRPSIYMCIVGTCMAEILFGLNYIYIGY